MSNQPDYTLYGYWRSSASWRVRCDLRNVFKSRLCLYLKDLSFDQIIINLVKGEQKSQAYTLVNPNQVVPSLKLGNGSILIQSPAILEYLEESHPLKPLLPKDSLDRACVRALMNMIVCDIHPIQNLRVLQKVGDAGKVEWARHFITLGFQALEQMLQKTAGIYCFRGTTRSQSHMIR